MIISKVASIKTCSISRVSRLKHVMIITRKNNLRRCHERDENDFVDGTVR
jgi:hypothetical protein